MLDPFSPVQEKDVAHAKKLVNDIHQQFIAVVREGRGKRLKETPDMFSGLIWTGQMSIDLGLADGLGTLDSVARDVVKADEIVDFSRKENIAEKFARRFGVAAGNTIVEALLRVSPVLR
jgi:protease-4